MHELALASGIVDAVTNFAKERGGKVLGFTVAVGELASFDKGLIESLLKELVKGTEIEGAEVKVEVEKAKVKCQSCGSLWTFDDLVAPLSENDREMIHFVPELLGSFAKCPKCGGRDFGIESGRSVRVMEIELA